MEKMIFQSLIDTFGIPLTLYPVPSKKGEYVDGEWKAHEPLDTEKVEINEPFVPSSLMTQLPVQSAYLAARTEKYEMIWFSTHKVEMKSIVVTADGKKYSVEDKIPYTDYSDVTQYFCRGVSNTD